MRYRVKCTDECKGIIPAIILPISPLDPKWLMRAIHGSTTCLFNMDDLQAQNAS